MTRSTSGRVGWSAGCVFAIALASVAGIGACRSTNVVAPGDLAPDFVLPGLMGNVQKLSNYRGKVVLVNLWATWCLPCIEEMPVLNRIAADYGPRGLVVVGVAGDEDSEQVRNFLDANEVDFQILLDPGGQVGTAYGITGYPETFVVDRDGRMVTKFIGPLPSLAGGPGAEVVQVLESTLARAG